MSLGMDKSTWRKVRFSEVVRNVNRTTKDPGSDGIDRVIAMEHMDPGELKIERWGDIADGTTFTRRVSPGQTLFGKRRAYQRKVAYAEFEAICSGDIYTFEAVDGELLPTLLPFLVQSEPFFEHALGTSAGSLSPRTNWRDLANFEFDLPPIDEQKRIAGLLWAVERHVESSEERAGALRRVLGVVTRRRMASMPETVRLGDVSRIRSGPSFGAADVHEAPVPGSIPVLGIPNTKPDGKVDLAGVAHVTGLPATTGLVDESSLILIRTNGNRQRIGNVYIPPAEATGYAVSAFQFLMRVNEGVDREYIYWVLGESDMQDRMSTGASGTVGLGNLAVRWLNELHIPWSQDASDRASLVEELADLNCAVSAASSSIAALKNVRSALTADIFGGN